MTAEPTTVFVYGSLMRGQWAHDLVAHCPHLGEDRTEPGYRLVDLGRYPAMVAVPGGEGVVWGEVLAVDAATLVRLDEFEDVPDEYVRTTVRLARSGPAAAYVYVGPRTDGRPEVPGGRWPGPPADDGQVPSR